MARKANESCLDNIHQRQSALDRRVTAYAAKALPVGFRFSVVVRGHKITAKSEDLFDEIRTRLLASA